METLIVVAYTVGMLTVVPLVLIWLAVKVVEKYENWRG